MKIQNKCKQKFASAQERTIYDFIGRFLPVSEGVRDRTVFTGVAENVARAQSWASQVAIFF